MKFGKLFKNYMNNYPNAAVPTANRCSKLPYNELRSMAKNMYHANRDTKVELNHYQNMTKRQLTHAVYRALGAI